MKIHYELIPNYPPKKCRECRYFKESDVLGPFGDTCYHPVGVTYSLIGDEANEQANSMRQGKCKDGVLWQPIRIHRDNCKTVIIIFLIVAILLYGAFHL